jgi:hypothetical protein
VGPFSLTLHPYTYYTVTSANSASGVVLSWAQVEEEPKACGVSVCGEFVGEARADIVVKAQYSAPEH